MVVHSVLVFNLPKGQAMTFNPLDLSGRVAVVIGATSGIGHTLALGLAEAGADAVPTGRRSELVAQTASEIESLGRRSLRCPSDVQDRGSLEHLLAATVEAFGKVDILINCAGRPRLRMATLDVTEEDWNATLDTNLTGTLRAAQVFGRHMLERGYGRIIHIASLSSFVALYEVAAYTASKAAVAALTRSLAIEWGPRGVLVNALAPGLFPTVGNRTVLEDSPGGREFLMRIPMKRFGELNELCGAAIFLASESASYVNGEVLVVDGGFLASGVNQ
jgi:NAD(P)-dependent dehydrogenase (short-subunit alcohol dehydrogenase family)